MQKVKEAFPEFEKPSIAIDTVIFRLGDVAVDSNRQVENKRLQVLLIKEHGEENWHLPGTILRLGETPKDAINRIMDTKAHLSDVYFEQLYTVADDPMRDARGHIISMVYIGIVTSGTTVEVCDNSRYSVKWAWVDKNVQSKTRELTLEDTDGTLKNLGYDHITIINDSIDRLKGKLLYTDIGFRFMRDKFTIKELENSFNVINERVIPGFRRIIKDKIEGTGVMSDGKAFRPAELFRKKG